MMKLAIIGRSSWLLESAAALSRAGYSINAVVTAAAASHERCGPDDYRRFATGLGASFHFIESGDRTGLNRILATVQADIGISTNWPTLLDAAALSCFRFGVLNSHTGDLPRYRGNACPNWAILRGENSIAICIHKMLPMELDAGEIYARMKLEIDAHTTISDVYAWTASVMPELWIAALKRVVAATPLLTLEVRPLRTYPRVPADSQIDWTQGGEQIGRLVRASTRPMAGAFSYLTDGRKVTIWSLGHPKLSYDVVAMPGQILGKGHKGPLVGCAAWGAEVVELLDYELEGGGLMPLHSATRLVRRNA